jgi:methionyl-tRNA synthetase
LDQSAPSEGKAFYITVAIDYPNGAPHVGHAYEKVAADAIARYHRLRGRPVFYLMGNDEHSLNVERAAHEAGMDPESFCRKMAEVFRHAWDTLGIGYDEFMRTNDPRHVRAVQDLVQRLYDGGHVYRGLYRGWYCVSCEAFVTEKEVVDGLCPVHRRPVEPVEEANWFFRLSSFRDPIRRHLAEHPEFVLPAFRRHEVESLLEEGLEDISISRARRGWGVPLPWDPEQVVYVWFDALTTYLSGVGFGWDPDLFARCWPADVHLVGKDITRFHCVIWPAMLMAAGLPLPRTVFAHGFLNIRGERLSKTTGNVVDPVAFAAAYGRDAARYYLLAETPFGHDGNLAPETFLKRYNSDLANDLGNLVHRVLAMLERFADGRVPAPPPASDDGFAEEARAAVEAMAAAVEGFRLHEAPAALLRLCARANKYIDEQAPWDLARRGERDRLAAVLYNAAETVRILALAFSPFLVDAPRAILRQLGLDEQAAGAVRWEDLAWGGLPPGTAVRRGAPLFVRLDAERELARAEVFGTPAAASDAPPASSSEPPTISLEEFQRVDLRVARVAAAERVAGADRLLRLRLDLGGETREVVSGIAAHYAPEDLVGRDVIVVANLAPRVIRGVRSQGMLLAAGDGEHLRVLTTDGPVPPGTRVR